MKHKIAPWKIKARDVVIESCRKWRGNLVWSCSSLRSLGDYVTLTVSDGIVTADAEISLRIVWKGGVKRDFGYLQTIVWRLMEDYYAQHEARSDHDKAAAQAWKETVSPAAEGIDVA